MNTSNLPFGKPRRNKFGIGSLLFCLAFGAASVGISSLLFMGDYKSRNWPEVDGTVTSIATHRSSDGTTYAPTVEYRVNGQTLSVESRTSSSIRPSIGSAKKVRYNPGDVNDAVIPTSGTAWVFALFPISGVAVIIIGIWSFTASIKRTGTVKRLVSSGQKITGVITNLTTNNRATRIIVSAQDHTGVVNEYISDPVAGNIFGALDYRENPIAIDVYIDPMNPKNYYVDLADIPQLQANDIAQLLQRATQRTQGPELQTSTLPTQDTPPPIDQTSFKN